MTDPANAPTPRPGEGLPERVADYPRPPALVSCNRHVRVEALGRVLCETHVSLRVLETFHPPTFYLPPESMALDMLEPVAGRSFCEWKGVAHWFDVVGVDGRRLRRAVWQYPDPTPAYRALASWYALYPGAMDGCWVNGERVIPQPGSYYGGWITSDIEGPFKGDPLHPELI